MVFVERSRDVRRTLNENNAENRNKLMVHTLFSPEVKSLLDENNEETMKVFLESLHPATVAEALTTDLKATTIRRLRLRPI